VFVAQTYAAVDVRCGSFYVGGRSRAEYTFVPGLRSGDGTSRGWL
jgi:hypothetical protein